jgi:hypothetical protein
MSYPSTGRPIVDLVSSKFRCNKDSLYLPVSRYEALYYPTTTEPFCGTFYFYEPESTNHLNLGNVLIAANKVDAMLQLEKIDSYKELLHSRAINAMLDIVNMIYGTDYYIENDIVKTIETLLNLKEFEARVRKTWNLVVSVLSNEDEISDITITNNNYIYDTMYNRINKNKAEYIAGNMAGLWDYLDQYICKAARKQGYDTIILQREFGKDRVVTEILDTRSKKKSYDNLCFLEPEIASSKKYPTIWFEDFGFIELSDV